MRKFLLASLFAFSLLHCFSQNPPVLRQFYFNPYLFNAAYAGISGYTDISLIHRQQWVNFNDAPVVSGFNIQYPTYKRVSFGFNFLTQDVVALRNSTAMATFAYRIPIARNQSLRFGISGGIGINNLNLDDADYSNDPTIINAAANKVYMDGNFGAVYSIGGLKIGFALPKLFGQKNISPQELGGYRFTQLKNQLYSVSYKFSVVPEKISLEPYFLYRQNRDSQNSWEAASVVYFKDIIWTGASYHNTNGIGLFLGFSIKNKFRISYSYELPPINSNFISTNSHEFHLSFRLGKNKNSKIAEKSSRKPVNNYTSSDSARMKTPKEDVAMEEEATNQIDNNSAPPEVLTEQAVRKNEPISTVPAQKMQEEPKPIVEPAKPPRGFSLSKGYYVVVGAFKIMENASHYLMTLRGNGYEDVSLAINPKNDLYYLYIFSSYDIDEARKARNHYRTRNLFKEAWILTIE